MKNDPQSRPPSTNGLNGQRNGWHAASPIILVADSDAQHRRSIATQLRAHQFTVIETGSGVETLEAAELKRPSLIFVDTRFPDADGSDTISQLKANPATSSIPLIALSPLSLRHEQSACRAAGAADWLIKPATPDQFLDAIQKHLRGASAHKASF